MLGCTETHVHKRMVRTQLRMMSTSDLHPLGSSQEELDVIERDERW
jgi:hypothetical protein